METLQIRAYNVQFGDAILISVPDRGETRHILVDVGNVLSKAKGGADYVFKQVVENILEVLDGQPLDLYVMTHEHLDHIQGLNYAEKHFYRDSDRDLCQKLQTRYAWLTASAEKNYYNRHPEAKERRREFRDIYERIDKYLKALKASGEPIPEAIEALQVNNNPNRTRDCMKYLRSLASVDHTCYVHRKFEPQGHHPFREAKIEIWAPEENTAVYYGRFRPIPMDLGVTLLKEGRRLRPTLAELVPLSGVDAGAFYNLVNMRRRIVENLLAIDKAANNTSIVFCLKWRGFRLLFTGDAEDRSWRTMDSLPKEEKVLKPVHFLKVSHHGSYNGTPAPRLLDKILPVDRQGDKPRYALVSTWDDVYHNVPDDDTLDLIRDRCDRLYEVCKKEPGECEIIEFEA